MNPDQAKWLMESISGIQVAVAEIYDLLHAKGIRPRAESAVQLRHFAEYQSEFSADALKTIADIVEAFDNGEPPRTPPNLRIVK